VVAGAHRVIASADLLDRINVFPVPDADTGQNLSATLWAVLHGLRGCRASGVGEVAQAIAQAALRGARGNSGVILAQFFQGLAEGLGEQVRVELSGFSQALTRAASRARQALAEPKEGTILSSISAFARRVEELAGRLGDFVPTLREGLAAARQALRESREILPSLKAAGVVDAGALGFVRFLEGIVRYISTGEVDELARTMAEPEPEKARVKYEPASISFRYCTECTLSGTDLPCEEIKRAWGELGDSVVVAGGADFLHLHVHTNVPARALEVAARFGEVNSPKVDDMWAQHAEAFGEPKAGAIALVVDTSCDLPDRIMTRHRIHIVPLRVRVGGREYRDRVELTPGEFYRLMSGDPQVGTSQPPPADFLEVYRHLGRNFSQLLALVLAKDLSGTWNSAYLASKEVSQPGLEVEVVDSGTLSGGLGLVAWAAALGIEAGLSLPQVVELARRAARQVKFWGGLPNLEPLGRSGRVPWVAGWLSGRLRLGMVISVGGGQIRPVAPGWGARQLLGKVVGLASQAISGMSRPLVVIPHAAAAGVAEALAGRVAEAAPGPDAEIHIVDASPALGVHAGLGAFGVALLDKAWVEQEIERLEEGR
jgi:hypothetical protein